MISNHTDLLKQELERAKGQRDAFKMAADQAIEQRDEARAQLANAAASEVDAVQGRQECERELKEARFAARRLLLDREVALSQRDNARAAIVELVEYLERVADNDIVDANELREFVAETKRMHGQEGADD